MKTVKSVGPLSRLLRVYPTVYVCRGQITALYYLNPDWEASMGGQLRIHLDPESTEGGCRTWDIEPVLDRLVLFRSDLVDHEVGLYFDWKVDVSCSRMCGSFSFIRATTGDRSR